MAFTGYLLKFGNTVLSHKYIQLESYDTTPNQRTELSAYRDNNNSLHRATSPNHKTTIKFTTMPDLTLSQKQTLQAEMSNGLVDTVERKYQITYWNDEQNCYVTSYFYMPDVNYQIRKIDGNNIIYNAVSFEFIEY